MQMAGSAILGKKKKDNQKKTTTKQKALLWIKELPF